MNYKESRMKKILILSSIILLFLITILIYYFTRYDTNDDGKIDLIITTNIFSRIHIIDLNNDGIFDVKEYRTYDSRIKEINIINKDYNALRLKQDFYDGKYCWITGNNKCENMGDQISAIRYYLNEKPIYARIMGDAKIEWEDGDFPCQKDLTNDSNKRVNDIE